MRFDPVVASVHVSSALRADGKPFGDWRSGVASTLVDLEDFADAAGPGSVIVGGDFNSTSGMRQFRDLLTNGYRDTIEQTGAGFAPTFQSHPWYPLLVTIDHVLTRHPLPRRSAPSTCAAPITARCWPPSTYHSAPLPPELTGDRLRLSKQKARRR